MKSALNNNQLNIELFFVMLFKMIFYMNCATEKIKSDKK
jgi:hypothetical protein